MKNVTIDFGAVTRQFEGLQGRHPGPVAGASRRRCCCSAVLASLLFVGWLVYWRGLLEELETGQQQRAAAARGIYQDKVKKAVNLDDLRKQKVQVEQYVGVLEKQLPSRAEMDALLTDINQAGVGRGAQLQLFKPGQVQVKDYYAELPIAVKVVGNYHDLGSFSSDIANLPRIVTLNNLTIMRQSKTNLLEMDATAKTFRYLDKEEIDAQRQAAAAEAKKPGAKKSMKHRQGRAVRRGRRGWRRLVAVTGIALASLRPCPAAPTTSPRSRPGWTRPAPTRPGAPAGFRSRSASCRSATRRAPTSIRSRTPSCRSRWRGSPTATRAASRRT